VSVLGFGAFKIGRSEGAKYSQPYHLPDDDEVDRLLGGVLDLGINLIDTAAAYGTSEERLGRALAHRRGEFVLSTKAGEEFNGGRSVFDFSAAGLRRSVQRSLRALRTDAVDLLLLHSNGQDLEVLEKSDAVATLIELRDAGLAAAIGFSGKTVEGAQAALAWADAIMVEYHALDTSHDAVMRAAHEAGVAVLVKKGLASGRLPPADAIPFVLRHPAVTSLVIGGLSLDHLGENVRIAAETASTR